MLKIKCTLLLFTALPLLYLAEFSETKSTSSKGSTRVGCSPGKLCPASQTLSRSLSRAASFRSSLTRSLNRARSVSRAVRTVVVSSVTGWKWKPLEEISFQGGDVIICLRHGEPGQTEKQTHWFLATNMYSLLYVFEPDGYLFIGYFDGRNRLLIRERHSDIDCDNCVNIGDGGYDIFKVIPRAMNWIMEFVYYHEDGCNSQNWVSYWVTGKAWEKPWHANSLYIDPPEPRDPKCRLNVVDEFPEPFNKGLDKSERNLAITTTSKGEFYVWNPEFISS